MQQQKVEIWGGIECSINRVNDQYFDQLERCGHYEREGDIERIISSGIKTIRYPILWEKHKPRKDQWIDWDFTASNLQKLRDAGVTVIAGLVHHGCGPAHVNFFDGSFEQGLMDYAEEVAKRFPWIAYYTPVNEPLTTARFCGLYGHWYPHHHSDGSFTRILVSECKATIMAMEAIRTINPRAQLVVTDDLSKTYSTPALQYQANFENERRWLSYDLITGRVSPGHRLWKYMLNAGVPISSLFYFMQYGIHPDIIGVNHYITSERYLDENLADYPQHTHGGNAFHQYADVEAIRVDFPGKATLAELLKEVWMRYKLPLAVTEVHLHCPPEEQVLWVNEVLGSAMQLRKENIPVKAVTIWALLGSFGWNNLLREPEGEYESGAFKIVNGELHGTPLVEAIGQLIAGQKLNIKTTSPGWWHKEERLLYRLRQEAL